MNTARRPMYAWQDIPWHKVERAVFKLQQRIYRASRHGDVKIVNLSDRVTPAARLQNRACDFRRTRLLDVFCLVMQHGPRDCMVTVSVEQLEIRLLIVPVVAVHMMNF